MTQYPRLSSFLKEISLDEINAELNTIHDDHSVEPIDDPAIACDFWDWADVTGVVDDYVPYEYMGVE